MRYKVGDKVRVRGDLEINKEYGNVFFVDEMEKYKGKVAEIEKEARSGYMLEYFEYHWTPEMLRPVEFKIWCETEEEKQAVLEELEKEGYVWINSGKKPTEWNGVYDVPMGFSVGNGKFSQFSQFLQGVNRKWFEKDKPELAPSEFTGINFSEKIIITKTKTGATASYGDKTVTIEGNFEDAARQALAEMLCPYRVGDRVCVKDDEQIAYKVESIKARTEVQVSSTSVYSGGTWLAEALEPYTEPAYNAKLFCIKGSDVYKEFEEGHIYKIIDGKFNGEGRRYDSLEVINRIFSAKFMEIKGGLDE